MLKLTVAVLAIALASSANAAGWRNLRIDASSEAAFSESVVTFQKKLSPSRRMAFFRSLQDAWDDGSRRATAEQREYTAAGYLRQLDGLGYEDVVKLTDPTGKKAGQYRAEYYQARALRGPLGSPTLVPTDSYRYPVSGGEWRGLPTLGGVPGRDGR